MNRLPNDFDRNFDRNLNRAAKGFSVAAIAIIVINLIVLGVGIWAVVELVQWLTSK